ncbi:hypothetical protein F4776DRAFT_673890 [Hypoxylon sp. NC0597]|nr:hypothetical protein F4776DRAFT_673890 [Hypoxylon sp. NC0597]
MDEAVFGTSAVMFALSLLAVGLRLYSRRLTKAGFDWDDGLVLLATALVVALFILSIHIWNAGYDRVSLAGLVGDDDTIIVFLLMFQVLYLFSMCFVKLSALFLYRRIFIQKTFQTVCKAIGIGVVLLYAAVLVETITISHMAANIWNNPDIGENIDRHKVDIGIAFFNVLGNVIVILLPIPLIWKLQMQVRTKISLTILFSLGLCVTVVSCIRLSYSAQRDYSPDVLIAYGSRDMRLQVLEPELAIFSLCLPVLRPLWRELAEKCGSIWKKSHESRRTSKMSNSTPLIQKNNNEERPMDWQEALGCGGTQTSITAKKDQTSAFGARYKPSSVRRPSQQPQLPQLARINVGRSWDISYEAASVIH